MRGQFKHLSKDLLYIIRIDIVIEVEANKNIRSVAGNDACLAARKIMLLIKSSNEQSGELVMLGRAWQASK